MGNKTWQLELPPCGSDNPQHHSTLLDHTYIPLQLYSITVSQQKSTYDRPVHASIPQSSSLSEFIHKQMEDHYAAIVEKNEPQQQKRGRRGNRGPSNSPGKATRTETKRFNADKEVESKDGKKGATGTIDKSRGTSFRRAGDSRGSSRGSSRSISSKSKKGSAKLRGQKSKNRRTRGSRNRSRGKKPRTKGKGIGGGGDKGFLTPRKAYSSAEAFMADHFPGNNDSKVRTRGRVTGCCTYDQSAGCCKHHGAKLGKIDCLN